MNGDNMQEDVQDVINKLTSFEPSVTILLPDHHLPHLSVTSGLSVMPGSTNTGTSVSSSCDLS